MSVFCGDRFISQAMAQRKAIPFLSGPVIDETGTLSREQADRLAHELRSYRTHLQIQIWITKNLGGETIEGLAIRAVDTWKLGDAGKDNGALVLVAIEERVSRLEVGRGLEGSIPDVIAGRIIESVLTPHFRNGDFYGGFSKATRFIFELATGAKPGEVLPSKGSGQREPLPTSFVIGIFILVTLFRIFFGGGMMGGRMGRGRYYGGASSWGGRSGGGGWSGGGGGFSGGGASGRW